MPAKPKPRPRYQPHPMLAREAKALAELEAATGRTFDQWVSLSRRRGPRDRDALRGWLKEQGLTQMRAHWVAGAALAPDEAGYEDPVPLVDDLYSGPREKLRPLHEKVVDVLLAQGADVLVTACKTMVPAYRKHVFAELRPVDGAVEVGLALGVAEPEDPTGRVEPIGSRAVGNRITHRVRVRSAKDVDAGLESIVARAYALGNGPIERAPPPEVPPADLAKALKTSAPARSTWSACTPSMQRDLVEWIVSAKKPETRAVRVARTLEALSQGRRRVY